MVILPLLGGKEILSKKLVITMLFIPNNAKIDNSQVAVMTSRSVRVV